MRFSGPAVAILSIALATACSHEKVAPKTPATANAPLPAKTAAAARDVSANQKMSNTLALSSDIVQLCGIKAAPSGASPKFGFDKADLSDDDHDILQQLATCMRTGPLQGKSVELIGRADRRGTEEYNLALGSRRARSVNDYLQSLGVGAMYLSQTSRGALDATGSDEAGWATDRRVDIMLRRG
jgi:outer membrane protein OmpA-like peptidoglycan-associated protein